MKAVLLMQLPVPLSVPNGLHIAGEALSYSILRGKNKQFSSVRCCQVLKAMCALT